MADARATNEPDRWTSMSVQSPRDQSAALSWFPAATPNTVVLYAEVYEADDGTTPRLRALVQTASGVLKELYRRNNKRSTVYGSKTPTVGLLSRARERGINAARDAMLKGAG